MSIEDISKYLVLGYSTGYVYLWEATNVTLINRLLMPNVPSIRSVNFNYNNDLLSVAYDGRTAKSNSL